MHAVYIRAEVVLQIQFSDGRSDKRHHGNLPNNSKPAKGVSTKKKSTFVTSDEIAQFNCSKFSVGVSITLQLSFTELVLCGHCAHSTELNIFSCCSLIVFSLLRFLLRFFFSLVFFLFIALSVGFSSGEPQCQRINETISNRDVTVRCGYNYTVRFKFNKHFKMFEEHVTDFKWLLRNCSTLLDVMACSIFLPRCSEEINGPYLPCRGVCYEWTHDCKDVIQQEGMEWLTGLCDLLPEEDDPQTTNGYLGRCFTPPNYRGEGRSK